jgi:ribosomal protein S18 acetylase RimI-like enzyme
LSRTVAGSLGEESRVENREVALRTFRATDQSSVLELYENGMLGGHIDPFDQASDLHRIEEEYLARPENHFWVAEATGSVVGTVAVAVDHCGVAHVRRLRVAPAWQVDPQIAVSLVRLAVTHARDGGCLKLIFHTPVNDVRAIEFLRHLGFMFSATRKLAGSPVLEFYNNLYDAPVIAQNEQTSGWALS